MCLVVRGEADQCVADLPDFDAVRRAKCGFLRYVAFCLYGRGVSFAKNDGRLEGMRTLMPASSL